ncbi:hypothetical protein KW782_01305 [Candidatus Parcubacteria bacterium]|nr:hypothetical protein [Candidatus Parcubacteria bacterium]
MKSHTIAVIVVTVIIFFGFGLYVMKSGNIDLTSNSASSIDSLFKQNKVENFDTPVAQAPVTPAGYKTFTHPTYKFSFNYPTDYTIGVFPEGAGEIVLVQKEGEKGVQIYSAAFDEPASVLTPERIKQDVPDTVINSPKQVDLGKTQGLYFQSESGLGKTHEFWFVYKDRIYQLSAPLESGALVENIVSSLRFE